MTLEMVSVEERAAMYGWYAPDPRMRANIGIRRRLATLLDNSRAEIEPDERAAAVAARQPLPLLRRRASGWATTSGSTTATRCGRRCSGTPTATPASPRPTPARLYLPTIQSLQHHYNSTNVEAQAASKSSLLHWTRGMLAIRKRHPVFGLGRYVNVETDNPAVLAFLRVLDDTDASGETPETVLCVNNMGSTPQAATLQARRPRRAPARRPLRWLRLPEDRRRRPADAVAGLARLLLAARQPRGRTVTDLHEPAARLDAAPALVRGQGPWPAAGRRLGGDARSPGRHGGGAAPGGGRAWATARARRTRCRWSCAGLRRARTTRRPGPATTPSARRRVRARRRPGCSAPCGHRTAAGGTCTTARTTRPSSPR
nr:alpha-glucosidase C-terminal domain-containing protein [Angustibacter aerolatus]